ncbi:MAG: sigW [Firmicutes bacterium]|nr:sigW [Bacillota bacterium]
MNSENEGSCRYNFDEIYETYWSRIHRYVERMIGSHEAEDLTQEIFIKVGNTVESFRNEAQLSTWIYKIATNTVIDRMRKSGYKQETNKTTLLNNMNIENDKVEISKTSGLGRKVSAVEGQVINKEMNSCIRGIVDSLPEKYRTVLVLNEMEGLKNREIAEVLGITLEAVKIRIHRAKAYLKNELVNQCDFYWDERNEMACDRKKPKNI